MLSEKVSASNRYCSSISNVKAVERWFPVPKPCPGSIHIPDDFQKVLYWIPMEAERSTIVQGSQNGNVRANWHANSRPIGYLPRGFRFLPLEQIDFENSPKSFLHRRQFLCKENPECWLSWTFLQSFHTKRHFFKTIPAPQFFQLCSYKAAYVKISFMFIEILLNQWELFLAPST